MTMFGDAAGDFSPLSFLTVTEVKNLGYEMGVPREWVDKIPEDGLVGTSDEQALGVTYKQIDEFVTTGKLDNDAARERIISLMNKSAFKLKPMAAFKPLLGDLLGDETDYSLEGIKRYEDLRQEWNL